MKTRKMVTLLMLCLLILSGCRKQATTVITEDTPPSTALPTMANEPTAVTESAPTADLQETDEASATRETEAPNTETTVPSGKQSEKKSSSESAKQKPTNPTSTKKETESSQPTTSPTVPEPTQSESKPTTPTQPTSDPTATAPTQPVTEPSKPEVAPTVPESKPTEPTGCSHDWEAIHHKETGHWKAGVICDCGWTVYGKADEVVSKWNAHSASYPAEVAFFEHGGYGSADKWIIDEPAYDEWVCRHCGEPKP